MSVAVRRQERNRERVREKTEAVVSATPTLDDSSLFTGPPLLIIDIQKWVGNKYLIDNLYIFNII